MVTNALGGKLMCLPTWKCFLLSIMVMLLVVANVAKFFSLTLFYLK